MKRTLSFLTLAMCATMGAWAQVKIGNIYYNLDEDTKTAEVTKPQSAYDYTFKYSGDIVIPASVTYEGKDYTVTSVGKSTFSAFYGITSIVLPTSLRNIGEYAFSSCIGLYALEIPEGVETIGKSAFSACINLTSLVIPNSVDSIGQSAFSHCNSLESVKFGSGLRSVGRALFEECANITTVEISNDNPYFDSREGCNAIIETSTNKLVAGCNATIVPSSVKSIALGAFMYCTFTSFELPEGLEEIEKTAFYTCRNLKEITIPASVKSLGYAFYHCTSLESLKVNPDNKVYDSRENCNAVIETATNRLIMGCKSSFIPDGVTSIGDAAFSGYWDLSSIELPSSLTGIGIETFAYCGLTSVTIPDGVTTIGVAAFSGCSALKTVSLPQSLTDIGSGAFSFCDALTSIYVYAKQPPIATERIATDVYDHCTLYVPKGSEEAYAAAEGWKDFKNIVAMTDENTGDDNTEKGIAIDATNFPDEFFRGWLLSQTYGKDGVLTDKEIAMVTEMDMSNKKIHNLEGIGYFTELKTLTCDDCNMSQLDLSHCPKLESLSCSDNKLTELDLSSCPSLTMLQCPQNQLTSINLSGCSELQFLQCHGNQLTAIDLSDCKGLIDIDCGSNLLTAIDLSPCTKLKVIRCVRNQLTAIDVSACKDLLSFDCQENQLTTLDVSGLTELNGLLCGMNALTSINISGCSKLQHLLCEFNYLDLNAFQHIVNNIPEYDEGDEAFMLIYSESPAEGIHDYTPDHNICSKEQVTIAKAKGWQVLCYTIDNCQPYEGVDVTPATDYLPFVELGKQWYVVSKNENPNYVSRWERYWMFEKVERGGKTYVHVYLNNDILCTSKEEGLFREEGCMVYKYDETTGRDVMLYDFSLEEGDTFTYEYGFDHPVNCKVLKQGWLKDGPQIVSSITRVSADSLDVKYRRLRTWTIGREGTDGQYQEVTTWAEGIGAPENMFSPLNMNKEGKSCLAYVKRDESISDYSKNAYLPFSFSNIFDVFGQIHGCNLPTGAEDNWESDGRHQLTYELEGNRLHVYGKVFTQCGPNNYAFFYEKPTDDPLVHKIEFIIQEVEPTMDCMALHQTDFYVPGFDPNMNYIVIDNNGEEHPVINENPQMAYRPFIEDGKVWKVGQVLGWEEGAQFINYLYFDGDTIINGQKAKRMLHDRVAAKEWESQNVEREYVGAWYEKDRKVYCMNTFNNDFKLAYDFSLNVGDTINLYDYMVYGDNGIKGIVTQRASGGIPGFKGTYLNIQTLWRGEDGTGIYTFNAKWMEGVGSDFPPLFPPFDTFQDPLMTGGIGYVLMSCTAGDEVIYYDSKIEDPFNMGAKKRRFDFNHTIKTQPKAPERRGEGISLYGEYNDLLLYVNLNPLDEAYLVRITDKSGKAVYEKTINASSIVGLNIDISSYPEGQYTITIENSKETFTGEFDTNATAIAEIVNGKSSNGKTIFNFQGQRIKTLQKGLNIVGGKKIFVK